MLYHEIQIQGRTFRPIPDSLVSKKPYIELVREDHFYALDPDDKRVVVKRWRDNIQEPLQYEVFNGKIVTQITELAVQEKDLRKQLEYDARHAGLELSKNKIDLLVAQLNTQINYDRYCDIAPKDIFISDDHPSIVFVRLNQCMKESLLEFCKKFCTEKEVRFIEVFIESQNCENGVLSCKGWKKFDIFHY